MKLPHTQKEATIWLGSRFRTHLEVATIVAFLLRNLDSANSIVKPDFRWLINTLKILSSADYSSFLSFTKDSRKFTFDSSEFRSIFHSIFESHIIHGICGNCGGAIMYRERVVVIGDDSTENVRCEKCSANYDEFRFHIKLTEDGFIWLKGMLNLISQSSSWVKSNLSYIIESRILYRDSIDQFDFASDLEFMQARAPKPQQREFVDPALRTHLSIDEAYIAALQNIQELGEYIDPNLDRTSVSTKFGTLRQWSKQVRNYQFTLVDPLNRLVLNPVRMLGHPNIEEMVGQLIWYFSGTNDITALRYYNSNAESFSDDGQMIDGSDYGYRLLFRNGNQVEKIVSRIRMDPSSRRTFSLIYRIEDVFYESRDNPCPIGIYFAVERKRLYATGIMRSNNAYSLLPFNIFFFTLLQEIVARELDLELGSYTHFAASMHYFQKDVNRIESTLQQRPTAPGRMRPIDSTRPLQDMSNLASFELDIRRMASEGSIDFEQKFQEALDFSGGIQDLALTVLGYSLRKFGMENDYRRLRNHLSIPFRVLGEPRVPV